MINFDVKIVFIFLKVQTEIFFQAIDIMSIFIGHQEFTVPGEAACTVHTKKSPAN